MKNIIIAVYATVLLVAGCEKRDEVEFVPTDPVLQWQDLEMASETDLEDGYVLLATEPTKGLFPAAVAVARVKTCYVGKGEPTTELKMNTETEAELLPWNSVLDDQRVVSGVFPIKPFALQGDPVTVGHLLKTSYDMKASLCLIYGTAELSENESEVRGVLYDTEHVRPLVALHSRARIEDLDTALAELPKPAPKDPEWFDASKDPRYHDPPGMAIYKFESLFRECVMALRKRDTPLENLPTEGWVPELPQNILIWPSQTNQPQPD